MIPAFDDILRKQDLSLEEIKVLLAAEGETTDDDGQDIVLNEQREGAKRQAGHQPDPPALLPPLVFHLDDQGMTDADAQEHGRADEDATEIHTVVFTVANIGKRNGTF